MVALPLALLLAAVGGLVGWASGALVPSHPVPGLIGSTPAVAEQRLQPLHFHLAVSDRAYDARGAAGTIISQRPSSGQRREGSTIAVTLSLGPRPVTIPGVVGLTSGAATALLGYVGLGAEIAGHVASMTVPAGVVVSSRPAHGTLLPGQRVALVVSSGKPRVAIPALTGASAASFAAAQRTLSAAGLTATETTTYNDTVPAGAVVQTNPAAGVSVVAGSPVTVVISKGPHLVPVPDVRGQSVGAASQTLIADGFQVSGVTGNPIATVTGTSPWSGDIVRFGSAVQIITG
jgi:serine/threonine-protein kinase